MSLQLKIVSLQHIIVFVIHIKYLKYRIDMLIIQEMTKLLHSKAFFHNKNHTKDYLRKKLHTKFMNINFFEL